MTQHTVGMDSGDGQSWSALEDRSWKRPAAAPAGAGFELALAADTSSRLYDGAQKTYWAATFRANEAGVADLSRLIISFAIDDVSNPEQDLRSPDVVNRATVESIELFNSRRLVVGLHHPRVPAGVFSSQRRQLGIELGQVDLASNDSIRVVLTLPKHRTTKPTDPPQISMAVPFRPKAGRVGMQADLPPNSLQCTAAATEVVIVEKFGPEMVFVDRATSSDGEELMVPQLAPEGWTTRPFHLRFVFEEDGVIDLDSLQLNGSLWGGQGLQPWDLLPRLLVEEILLPDGRNLVVGNERQGAIYWSPSIASSIFSAQGRFRDWFHFGQLEVRRGQQITVKFRPARDGLMRPDLLVKLLKSSQDASIKVWDDFFENLKSAELHHQRHVPVPELELRISGAFRFYRVVEQYQALVCTSDFFDRQPVSKEAWRVLTGR